MLKKELKSAPSSTGQTDDSSLLARRRLLKLGAYVPPAIIGMAVLGSMPGSAFASGDDDSHHSGDDSHHGGSSHGTVGSCMPSACQPCIDEDGGDDHHGDDEHHGDGDHHGGGDHKSDDEDKRKKHHHSHDSEKEHRQCLKAREQKKRRDEHEGKSSSHDDRHSSHSSGSGSSEGKREKSAWPFF